MKRVNLGCGGGAFAAVVVTVQAWHLMYAAPSHSVASLLYVLTMLVAFVAALFLGLGTLAAYVIREATAARLATEAAFRSRPRAVPLRADAPAGPRSRPRSWQPVERLPDSLAYDDLQADGEYAAYASTGPAALPDPAVTRWDIPAAPAAEPAPEARHRVPVDTRNYGDNIDLYARQASADAASVPSR